MNLTVYTWKATEVIFWKKVWKSLFFNWYNKKLNQYIKLIAILDDLISEDETESNLMDPILKERVRKEKEEVVKARKEKDEEVNKILERARRARTELEQELLKHSDSLEASEQQELEANSSIPVKHKTVR